MRPLDACRSPMSASTSSRLPVAFDTGNSDDLTAMHGQRHVVEDGPYVFDDRQPGDVELDLVGDCRLAGVGLR